MPGRNRTPLLGWHPKSAELVAWFEAEVERRGGGRGVRSAILDEALADFRGKVQRAREEGHHQPSTFEPPGVP